MPYSYNKGFCREHIYISYPLARHINIYFLEYGSSRFSRKNVLVEVGLHSHSRYGKLADVVAIYMSGYAVGSKNKKKYKPVFRLRSAFSIIIQ